MKKNLYTLNIGGTYAPEICEMTYPLLKYWANKIGADFIELTERKFPDYPERYEKFQIYTLAKERPADWHIYIDCDALINPDMIDPTGYLPKDTVAHNGQDVASNRWKLDQYFWRDGRHISSCNWLMIASDWCLDVWHPLEDMTLEEAAKNIFPVTSERNGGTQPIMLIDDYVMSRNIARYGLKFTTVTDVCKNRCGYAGNFMMMHQYNCPAAEKVAMMKNTLKQWGLS